MLCRDRGFDIRFIQSADTANDSPLLPPWLSGIRCAGLEPNAAFVGGLSLGTPPPAAPSSASSALPHVRVLLQCIPGMHTYDAIATKSEALPRPYLCR